MGDALQSNAILFIAAFFTVWLFGSLALGALGLDLTTALSAALTALTNVGPGIGDVVGPAVNFSSLPSPAKLILIALMLIGRLEILAALVLATPTFWTR
ncbi:potassium transporter TrkG [Mesorhizobium sp. SB112]|uniref:potassium transporter TrkG n=1 Tax=Mesorhizobium sp. SB112 TaxID=3151853 RepID=UPI003264FDED